MVNLLVIGLPIVSVTDINTYVKLQGSSYFNDFPFGDDDIHLFIEALTFN